jgi:hypothetical protein
VVWSGAVEGGVVVVSGGKIWLNPILFFGGRFGLARELGRNENKNYDHMTISKFEELGRNENLNYDHK